MRSDVNCQKNSIFLKTLNKADKIYLNMIYYNIFQYEEDSFVGFLDIKLLNLNC